MSKILLGVLLSTFLYACGNEKGETTTATNSNTADSSTKKSSSEILDMSEADGVKAGLIAFSKGDIEGMTANYDDNVRQIWSSGDSLVGKKAVIDYYKTRWGLIDSLSFSDHVVLPIRMSEQQSEYAPTGKWVLHWAFAHVKYKNGKKLDFWVHNANHYNDAGKIDIVGQYLDRHPLIEATKDLMPK